MTAIYVNRRAARILRANQPHRRRKPRLIPAVRVSTYQLMQLAGEDE